jgi:hypothetical protein
MEGGTAMCPTLLAFSLPLSIYQTTSGYQLICLSHLFLSCWWWTEETNKVAENEIEDAD